MGGPMRSGVGAVETMFHAHPSLQLPSVLTTLPLRWWLRKHGRDTR